LSSEYLSIALGPITNTFPASIPAVVSTRFMLERDRKLEAAREIAEESPPAGCVTDEADYFRFADNPLARTDCLSMFLFG
jgi:hypothetical protein